MDPHSESNSRLKVFLENPSKALWTLAIPIMFGMGIQTLYNLVDMIFIGLILHWINMGSTQLQKMKSSHVSLNETMMHGVMVSEA